MAGNSLVRSEIVEPGVVALTLNRPAKRNALSRALMEALCREIEIAEAVSETRVMILRGAGEVFCAGLDDEEAAETDKARATAQLVTRTLHSVHRSRLISIAAVRGTATAAGAGLMTACDIAVIEGDVKIGYPETHRGRIAALWANLLCDQVPLRQASELLLTGELIGAGRAFGIGLVNRVVPSGQAFEEARRVARQVLRGGPQAIVRTKRLIAEHTRLAMDGAIDRSLDEHLAAEASEEAGEGRASKQAKRSPEWAPPGASNSNG